MSRQSIWVVALAVTVIGVSSTVYGQRADGPGGAEPSRPDRGRGDRRQSEDGGAEAEIRQLREQVSRLSQQLEKLESNVREREDRNSNRSAGDSRHQERHSHRRANRLNVRGRRGSSRHGFGSHQHHQAMAHQGGRQRHRSFRPAAHDSEEIAAPVRMCAVAAR